MDKIAFLSVISMNMAQTNHRKFGKLVKDWRESKGLTQEKLAFAAEISVTYMSKIENGLANVSLDTICKLAKGLRISVSELMQGM